MGVGFLRWEDVLKIGDYVDWRKQSPRPIGEDVSWDNFDWGLEAYRLLKEWFKTSKWEHQKEKDIFENHLWSLGKAFREHDTAKATEHLRVVIAMAKYHPEKPSFR